MLKDTISQLVKKSNSSTIEGFLSYLANEFPGEVTFSTSFSYEDQVITHIILSNHLPISIFTLDTGRLFSETYTVWNSTNEKYDTHIKGYFPDKDLLEKFVAEKGPDSFYKSVENRKECCYIRKVDPLKRALKDQSVWITGLRAEHSPSRHLIPKVEWDETNGIIKYHPILNWSGTEIADYIHLHNIPYNALHEQGFVSIGCAPCTRAIEPGEDFRAGRWWWEESNKKECGLHAHPQDPKTSALGDEAKL